MFTVCNIFWGFQCSGPALYLDWSFRLHFSMSLGVPMSPTYHFRSCQYLLPLTPLLPIAWPFPPTCSPVSTFTPQPSTVYTGPTSIYCVCQIFFYASALLLSSHLLCLHDPSDCPSPLLPLRLTPFWTSLHAFFCLPDFFYFSFLP